MTVTAAAGRQSTWIIIPAPEIGMTITTTARMITTITAAINIDNPKPNAEALSSQSKDMKGMIDGGCIDAAVSFASA